MIRNSTAQSRGSGSLVRWALIGLGLILLVSFGVSQAVDAVETLGRNLPQARIDRDYDIGLVVAIVIGLSILGWPVPARDKPHLLTLWAAKCVVTLGIMLIYEWRYNDLDSYFYFQLSHSEIPPTGMGFGNGTENMRAITWGLATVIPDSYHGLKVCFSLAGFIGLYLIYRGAVRFVEREDPRIFYFIALFPSCIFWSSILGKDPIQLLGVGLYVYGVIASIRRIQPYGAVATALGLLLSMWIRLWTGPILVIPLLVFPILAARGVFRRLALATLIGALLVFAGGRVADRFQIDTAEDAVNAVEQFAQTGAQGASAVRPAEINNATDLLAYTPRAMFTALFRPVPGELRNYFGTFAGIENGILLALVTIALLRLRRGAWREPLVVWAMLRGEDATV